MKKTLLALFSIFFLINLTNSQTVWEKSMTNIDDATGNNPYTIASDFIDGDGNLDILVGTDTDHILVWYKGNGDGTFVEQPAITNTLVNIVGIKLFDVNNDTYKDIIAVGFGNYTGSYGANSKLVWFTNDGSGNFGAEQLITDAYSGMSGLFIGTIDSGSTPDIAVTALVDNHVLWFSNDGSGNFTSPTTIDNTLSSPGVINMKDIDSDGDLDAVIATAAYSGDVIEIFRNDLIPGGTVAFTKDATSVATGKVGIFNANFVDLDGDSNLDILATEISCGFCSPSTGNLYWYEDNGAGFTEIAFNPSSSNPSVAQVKDVDNDNIDDIVLSHGALAGSIDLVWYKNNGSGSFGPEQTIDNTLEQVFVYNIADYDNDGDLDIASCEYGSDSLAYIENKYETLEINDFDKTGIKIFPNPTKDFLNFEGFNTASIQVSIYDILGKRVAQKTLNNGEALNVSELSNGIYTLKINNELTSKFIKE
ncbi:T9SS type A sorting domain-containing protein [Winogradskyella pulchriflava]|uniref:T9SS type A sorting domain-containing protein n=1 Tax=Winogradskyella pulchriflava TaxID=1110688 RepID=A0ABV6QBV1_9FLAO